MSRMGEELEKRLDANKYHLYEALKNIVYRHEQGLALGEGMDLNPAREVLAKIEHGYDDNNISELPEPIYSPGDE